MTWACIPVGQDRVCRIHGRQQAVAAGGGRLPDGQRWERAARSAQRLAAASVPPADLASTPQGPSQRKGLLPFQRHQHLLLHQVPNEDPRRGHVVFLERACSLTSAPNLFCPFESKGAPTVASRASLGEVVLSHLVQFQFSFGFLLCTNSCQVTKIIL